MSLRSILDALRSIPPRARFRPRFEPLDDRCLPSFSPATSLPSGPAPAAVASADFNNDGRIDLVSVNTDSVSFRPGDGSGGFGDPISSAAASAAYNTQSRSLAVGDFNNDGKLDLAMVNDYMLGGWNGYSYTPGAEDSNGVSVMLGNGDGSFQAPLNVPLYQGTKATSVAVGDFNRDGAMDLAVASTTDPYYPGDVYEDYGVASVLLSNGDGSFHLQDGRSIDRGYGISRPTPAAVAVAVADFNGDGNQDFAVGTRNYSFETGDTVEEVAMLLGDGQGNIAGVSYWRLDHGWSMAAGDLDRDGDADLVTVSNSSVKVRLGNGAGGFEAPPGGQSYAVGPGAFNVVLGDFNHDGVLDIATANSVGDSVSVLRGRGDGTFREAEHFPSGLGSIAITAGDFNGDGWPDVATANVRGDTVSVLENDRDWSSAPLPTISVGDATVTEGNTGTITATFTVTLSVVSAVDVTVHYATSDVSAAAGSDYATASGTVTVPAGRTSATFTITVTGDRLAEPTETFAVNLSAPTNATVIGARGVGTILDNEPRISVADVSVKEGRVGVTYLTFTVRLSAAYDEPVTVRYTTQDDTATAGSDYEARSGTLTFAPGETTQTVRIAIFGDNTAEADEYFRLLLSDPSGTALISDPQGVGTIANDDKARRPRR
jgi:hypothetical protein